MKGYHWLASYPKSGNTWLRLALASLKRGGVPIDFAAGEGGADIASSRTTFDQLLGIDSSDLSDTEVESLRPRFYEAEASLCPEPQLRKVHDAWTNTPSGEPLFPPSLTLATIYMVRDPRDVAVSLSHHVDRGLDWTVDFMNASDSKFAVKQGAPQLSQRLLDWSSHVRSWIDSPVQPLVLRYEDILADPARVLKAAAEHLGWITSPSAIARAVEATRFDVLRAAEDRDGFAEKPAAAKRFFRRGVAGGWRDSLSPNQIARLEAAHAQMMKELGYEKS